MTALELLTDLRERGVKLWVDGADLRFSAPKGTLGFGSHRAARPSQGRVGPAVESLPRTTLRAHAVGRANGSSRSTTR